MKNILFFILLALSFSSYCQNISDTVVKTRIILYNGNEFIGQIISKDSRDILVLTEERGPIYIPQYEIKNMIAVRQEEYNQNGEFIGEDIFATRYFISTNGLPIKKGEHYVQWNLFGPDFQFAVTDHLGIGVMTSWLAMPIIANAKYSFKPRAKWNFAIGALAGTGSWGAPDFGLAIPFATIGYGNRKSNFALSAGYGAFWIDGDQINHAMTSVGTLIKLNKKFSLVIDGIFVLPAKSTFHNGIMQEWDEATQTYVDRPYQWEEKHPGMSLILPGLRWQTSTDRALQFGFSGVHIDGSFLEVPIPMVQWYRKL